VRLPPLNAVKAFEAAARAASFKKAAEELHVTPGAVTKQIQILEDYFGVRLFTRGSRSVALTAPGEAYFRSASEALGSLERGARALLAADRAPPLRFWCTGLFMHHWLVHRLGDFHRIAPEQEVVITVGDARDPVPPDTDLGIRVGGKRYAGMRSHFLMDVHLVPVCSPAYLAASAPLRGLQDLAQHTLLESAMRPEVWTGWLHRLERNGVKPRRISFPNASAAYSAAIAGAGVAVGQLGFIERELASGQLVVPFDVAAQPAGAYYLVGPARRPPQRLLAFRRWILDQFPLPAPPPVEKNATRKEISSIAAMRPPADPCETRT
jgi:LysR family glycine cleavage system transcriptional activator